MDEAVSTATKEKPPWPHTAGRTLTPSFVFTLVDLCSVPRSLSMSSPVRSRKRFKIKGRACGPFLFPSSSLPISSMVCSIFDRPPTPYPTQTHSQPFATATVHPPMAMIVDHPTTGPAATIEMGGDNPWQGGVLPRLTAAPALRDLLPAIAGTISVSTAAVFEGDSTQAPISDPGVRSRPSITLINEGRRITAPALRVEELNLVRSNSSSSISSVALDEDFVLPRPCVPSPTPAGMYDPADYHLLLRHQHFDDLYESITTALVNHFTTYPAANAAERESRLPPRKPALMDD
ncbi:hypothetical protein PGT21_013477 [Puccinia graminis f. sp. tritici]|uniref:Uncharacterized protein n=1 Tax=Puccinia graminis f. sp. tritici TaxID=56615 RepID=A0A5B0P4F8_PUCGR|nr:hypothetical protein PGT21_013477 [Puccinia graminis f. sp. tritici]